MKPPARAAVAAGLIFLAATGCTGDAPPPATSHAPASAEPVVVSFAGTVPDGWDDADGDSVPAPDSESVFFEIHQNQSVMSADCTYAPESGVGTVAAEIVEALATRDGLEVAERGTVMVGGQPGAWVDLAASSGTTEACPPDEPDGFVPLFGHYNSNDEWLFTGASAGETHRVIAFDTPAGGNVLIWIYATEPETVADHLDDAMSVVEGLEIEFP